MTNYDRETNESSEITAISEIAGDEEYEISEIAENGDFSQEDSLNDSDSICGYFCDGSADDGFGSRDGYFGKIQLYGKKADKTEEEYLATGDDEKLEYIILKFRPLCLKVAKKYRYDGAEFQDMYMEACLQLMEVVSKYGIDDPKLSYRIASNVGVNVKRAVSDDKKECGHLSYDDEKNGSRIETNLCCDTQEEQKEYAELFEELEWYLSGQELEIAKQLCITGGQTTSSLAKDFSVSKRTMDRRLAEIREKLEPLRRRLHERGVCSRSHGRKEW